MPRVSVILPTYNRLAYLRHAIDSVVSQTFRDWELIVADDGSSAETWDFLAALVGSPQVTVMRLAHSGSPSHARNAACKLAGGKYLAFLDSDDAWLPRKLEVQCAALSAAPHCRWSYTGLLRIDGDGNVLPGEHANRRIVSGGNIFTELLTLQAPVAVPCVMVERALFETTGGFDEQQSYFEDFDLWHRLLALSEVCAVPEPLTLVRCHQEHYSSDRVGVYNDRFRLLEKIDHALPSPEHRMLVRREVAMASLSLAGVLAGQGRIIDAGKQLWRSRKLAWRDLRWWRVATYAIARSVTPSPLRRALGAYRRRTGP